MKWGMVLGMTAAGVVATAGAMAKDVDPSAYTPYTKKAHPKTFKSWGKSGIDKINKYMKEAAIRASQSPKCDNVESSDLSDNRSAPPNKIVIFVDCSNGERFYFASSDLDSQGEAVSQKEKTGAFTDSAYVARCEEAIRMTLKFPSSMDKDWFSTNVYRAPTGNVAVTFDFSAKNGFGGTLPQKARCAFDDRGMHPVEITNR